MKKINKEKIAIEIMRRDVEAFGKFFFKHHLVLNTPEFHKEIYDLYQSNERFVAIAAPRGHAKSTITDLVYLAWLIVHKKVKFVLLTSDTFSQSVLFLETLKAEIEGNDRLIEFYGDLKSDKWSDKEIVCNGVMVRAIGAGMKVRGLKYLNHRPDLILVDDLENDELVENMERREKLERWFNGALIPSMDKNGRLIMIGTILHYDSLLAKIVIGDGYPEFKKKIYRAINGGEALWPEHLNIGELNRIKEQYISKGQAYLFYQEYQNDPISGENRKFKLEKFKYYDEKDIAGKELSTYITYDRAYSVEKTADFTGIVVLSVDIENNWYVRQAERFKGEEKELINKMFGLKDYYKPSKQGIEQKAFQHTLKPWLEDEMRRRNNFFTIEELKDLGRSKNMRIEGLLPRFETGTLYFKKEHKDLIDELITFPKGIHDDLADALAYQLEIAERPASGGLEEQDFNLYNQKYD